MIWSELEIMIWSELEIMIWRPPENNCLGRCQNYGCHPGPNHHQSAKVSCHRWPNLQTLLISTSLSLFESCWAFIPEQKILLKSSVRKYKGKISAISSSLNNPHFLFFHSLINNKLESENVLQIKLDYNYRLLFERCLLLSAKYKIFI